MTTTIDQPRRRARSSPSATEVALLVLALAALAFAAGAGGWVLGRGSASGAARTVTVVRAATAGASSAVAPKGDAAAGRKVFVSAGCGSCHALRAAGATATVGPNLDQAKLTPAVAVTWIAKGKRAMPPFQGQLTPKQIADVAAFVTQDR